MSNIIKPSILPGFMELLPHEQKLFNEIVNSIKNTYEKYGFIPIDTPTIEKSEILLAKTGGETEKQIYRFTKGDNDLSLRFDLTVPLARYVAQHFNDLTFPFRRYHIGKVFRGEKAQKGRFREFYQCDIDIIGNEKLDIINDAEIPSIIYSTFKSLGFDDFIIRINNRKVLNGFFESVGVKDNAEVLRIIDKLEKIGTDSVKDELKSLNLNNESVSKIIDFISIKGDPEEIVSGLVKMSVDNDLYKEGVKELKMINEYIGYFQVPKFNYKIDLTIARGLDYYTGTVYETILTSYPEIGSVCSGGRYDDLAGYYIKKKLPGVGISIGLTRLFYQLTKAKVFQTKNSSTNTKLLIIPIGDTVKNALEAASIIRNEGVSSEVYLNKGKISQKFSYADKLGIPYVIVLGEDEIKTNILKLKDMKTGEQKELSLNEIIKMLKDKI